MALVERDSRALLSALRELPKEFHEDVKDCHGNLLSQGDAVLVIKNLKVKGNSVTLKLRTKVKNLRLTENPDELEEARARRRGSC